MLNNLVKLKANYLGDSTQELKPYGRTSIKDQHRNGMVYVDRSFSISDEYMTMKTSRRYKELTLSVSLLVFGALCIILGYLWLSTMLAATEPTIGGAGTKFMYSADTTLRFDAPGFVSSFSFSPMGFKQKWSSIDVPMDHKLESSLGLRLGHLSSSLDIKWSTETVCTSMSSIKRNRRRVLYGSKAGL